MSMDVTRYHNEGPTAQDAFRARMDAQCNQIELYRRLNSKQGRPLTFVEAAQQWIKEYAEFFAEGNDDS
jgi:hypothetical protein